MAESNGEPATHTAAEVKTERKVQESSEAELKSSEKAPVEIETKSCSHKIPSDKVNLKFILVSGKTGELLFSHTDTASTITQYVYDHWPKDWADETKPETNILRLIYLGRFLHDNVSLGALKLAGGKTTVMHLVARENLPESNQGSNKRDKGASRSTPSAANSRPQERRATDNGTSSSTNCCLIS